MRRLAVYVLIPAVILAACLSSGPIGLAGTASAASACPWMNTHWSASRRANTLVAHMTLDQKIAMVHNSDNIWTYYGVAGHINGIPALCIPDLVLNDAGQGVGDQSVNTTAFPAPIAQAASWDRRLQRAFGVHLGHQAWQKGINVQLAPGIEINRVPMNGRNWEYMGEDPFLTGQTAAAEVRGLQSQHVIATLKHYILNSEETNRNTESSEASARTIHEIYLPGYEAAIHQGRAGAVMCSYNRIDGQYACQNKTTLKGYLKHEVGFDGFVMSDWGATHSTVSSANHGLDMEMNATVGPYYTDQLKAAVQSGKVKRSRLNDMVTRIMRTMFRVGLFDHPTPAQPGAYGSNVDTSAAKAFARRVAEAGTVLLKDNKQVLPLASGGGHTIALIGRNAGPQGTKDVYNGGGSGHIPEAGTKSDVVSPLQGMQARAAKATDVVTYNNGDSIQDAVAAATAANYAIVFAYDVSAEGTDLPSLSLDDASGQCAGIGCNYQSSQQNELIAAVAAANPRTIVVLNTAGPVLMPWASKVAAIVEAWYPGEQDGAAIARVLYGDVNPGGKLPQTFPVKQTDLPTRTASQYPGVNLHVKYLEGLLVGYRWFDAERIAPLFCFGHGLSYTSFGYSGLQVQRTGSGARVSFSLTNTGNRRGSEVPQLYVRFPSSTGEPPQQLKGYAKVSLAAGAAKHVTLTLNARSFSTWSPTAGWHITPGDYGITVGSSSCDIRLMSQIRM